MRTKRSIKNLSIDFCITFSLVLSSFILRKIFIDEMGSNITGIMLLFTQLMGILNLAEMGVATATASLLYKQLYNNDYKNISILVSSARKIYIRIFYIFLVLGLILGIILQIGIENVKNVNNSFYYWSIFVFNAAITYRYAHFSILLTSDQKYYKTRIIQGCCKIICVLIQIISIIILKNFFIYLLIETIINIIQYFLFKKTIKKNYPLLTQTNKYDSSVSKKIKDVIYHKIGGALVFNTDYIIISKYLSLKMITIYSCYMMIFQAFSMISNILTNSLTASVGNYLQDKDKLNTLELWNQIRCMFFFLSSTITVLTYLLIDSFIILWIGEDYILNEKITLVLIFNLFILLSRPGVDIFKNASGQFGDIYLPIIEGLINVIISLLLIRYIGILGVIIGTAVSNIIIIYFAKPIYLYKKIFNLKSHTLIISQFKYLFQLIFLIFITIEIKEHIPIENNSIISWLTYCVIYTVILLPLNFLLYSINKDFRALIMKLVKYHKKKNV